MTDKKLFMELAGILSLNEEKYKQFDKIYDLCINYTSDSGIEVTRETYEDVRFHLGTYYRFIIKGTRCSMTITYECGSWKLIRKPRNSKAVKTEYFKTTCEEVCDYIKKELKSY